MKHIKINNDYIAKYFFSITCLKPYALLGDFYFQINRSYLLMMGCLFYLSKTIYPVFILNCTSFAVFHYYGLAYVFELSYLFNCFAFYHFFVGYFKVCHEFM